MKISEFAVKNRSFTSIIFLMIVALGLSTLVSMPKSEDPELHSPFFFITAIYPGAGPEDIEEGIIDLIEERFAELEDINKIKSTAKDGVGIVELEYNYQEDVEDKYQEVIREINNLKSDFPEQMVDIFINKADPTNVKVLQMALISENAPTETLRAYAENLESRLEKLGALKNIDIYGLEDRIARIDLNTEKLEALHIPIDAVLGAIQSEMVDIPAGSISLGSKTLNVKTTGNYRSLEEIANTVVYSTGNSTVLLKNVADVNWNYEETDHLTRLNGHRAIFVTAAQKKGKNILQTKEDYAPVLEAFKESLPPNIDFVPHFVQAKYVQGRLEGLGIDFLIAIGLVLFTLLPLGYRASAVVMISIPLSLSIGIVLLNLMGYSLNQLSIVGLVVALGLLVDDSIVVVENIESWLRKGYSKVQASILATKQIGMAVLGFTATLIIAFLPLIFLPGSAGDFIRGLPLAVILTVLASMLVSLSFTPFLSSLFLKKHEAGYEGNIFLIGLKKIISGSYSKILTKALARPRTTLIASFLIIGVVMSLFGALGFALFPASEKPQFLVNIVAPNQSSIAYTDSLSKEVEKRLERISEIEYYATNVGRGNPQIYYNINPERDKSNFAQIFVQLNDATPSNKKLEIIDQLRQDFSSYSQAKIEVKNFEQGPPIIAPLEVRLEGESLDTLRSLALKVESILEGTEGAIYIDNPVRRLKSNLKVAVNKPKARALNLSLADVDRNVRLAVAGLDMGEFSDQENEEHKVLVGLANNGRPELANFRRMNVNNRFGQTIPLDQVASFNLESAPIEVKHYNRSRTVSVSAFLRKGYLPSTAISSVEAKMQDLDLPLGYSFAMGGEAESKDDSFDGFGSIILITVFLFIAVLILEFKTFKSTLIVLSVIPLGAVGAVLALYLTGNPMSFVAIIGLIALAGIEIKNSILLVDFTNQLRVQGWSLDAAIEEAGEKRFLPIILTALTAIGGLTPIALSSNPLISPLAIVIIGGLISSTILSRVVTPVVYKLLPPKIEVEEKPTD